MINIENIVVTDFLAYAQAATDAHSRVMDIRSGMKRRKESNLTEDMIRSELTPAELAFAKRNYYIFPESSRF